MANILVFGRRYSLTARHTWLRRLLYALGYHSPLRLPRLRSSHGSLLLSRLIAYLPEEPVGVKAH
jgi:hypothetical protein